MNYRKVLDNEPDSYFLIKDKNNKVIYPKDKGKLDYIKSICKHYSKENKCSTFDNRNFSIKKRTIDSFHKNYTVLYIRDITDFISLRSKFEIDPLTTVLSRKVILDKIDKYISENKLNFSIVMGDIDDFKKINDTYGHIIGDVVLNKIGNILRCELPDSLVGRYGGEEFIILMPNTNNSFEKIEKVRELISNIKVNFENIIIDNISMSFGIYNITEDIVNEDVKSLRKKYIGNADKALYTSKENNKNKTTVY